MQQHVVTDRLTIHAGKHIPREGAGRGEHVAPTKAGANPWHAVIRGKTLSKAEGNAGLDVIPQIAEADRKRRQCIGFDRPDRAGGYAPCALVQQFRRWGVVDLAAPAVGVGLTDDIVEAVLNRLRPGSRPGDPQAEGQDASGVLTIAHEREIPQQNAGIGTIELAGHRGSRAHRRIDLLRQAEPDALLATVPQRPAESGENVRHVAGGRYPAQLQPIHIFTVGRFAGGNGGVFALDRPDAGRVRNGLCLRSDSLDRKRGGEGGGEPEVHKSRALGKRDGGTQDMMEKVISRQHLR
ncbi:hypothetical protein GALL_534810 [mine drainage metagenome]|uniref:Uncharacterized protein n=1 Tax=mine drainage metagenome TaxID=410659 RepID=A0A1J5P1I7_9ZZZZ